MLNEEMLNAFMNSFLGYGDLEADTWFVGMEESGGNSLNDVQKRIEAWDNRGRCIVEDCAEYHHAIGSGQLFTHPVRKAQSTWDWLIRAQLKSEDKVDDVSATKAMQCQRWLRHGSKTCGLELLPLPSPNSNDWLYSRFSNDPILHSRDTYKSSMLPTRKAILKRIINEYNPRNVVFYSKDYETHWQDIVGMEFSDVDGIQRAYSAQTSFFLTLHPTARIKGTGKKKAYWANIGAQLRSAK